MRAQESKPDQSVLFWNGNKSVVRQQYELALLRACLNGGKHTNRPALTVLEDKTDYPKAEDEANIFSRGVDILVTVAGNKKFSKRQKIVINQPLAKGLLGYRLLVVREESLGAFAHYTGAEDLKNRSVGIPRTWVDADLFRHNGYKVVERGTLDSLFVLLKDKAFDYAALGANEIEGVFQQYAAQLGGLAIESNLMLYYPFPLIFYVNPAQPALAQRVEAGLTALIASGEFDALFAKYYGDAVQRLELKRRKIITLQNPLLPEAMLGIESTLFG